MEHPTDVLLVRLRTSTVAEASGYSVQQVRNLEALGVLPPAGRSANGYREFSDVHVLALRAYRDLATAVGPVVARRSMRELRALSVDRATALVSGLHVTLAKEREDALAALRALEAVRAEASGALGPPDDDAMTISELAAALGVRTSTLRFWEQAGLVAPERVGANAARHFGAGAVREARITAALRAAGYRIPDVQAAMTAVRGLGEVDDPVSLLHARLDTVAERTLALLSAGTELVELIRGGRRASPGAVRCRR